MMPAGGKPYGPKSGRKKSDAGSNAYDTGMNMRRSKASSYNTLNSPSDRAMVLNLGVQSARTNAPGTRSGRTVDPRQMPTSSANDMAARARGMSPMKPTAAKKAAPAKPMKPTAAKKAAPAKRGSRRMG
jgi:hypothetical protein